MSKKPLRTTVNDKEKGMRVRAASLSRVARVWEILATHATW